MPPKSVISERTSGPAPFDFRRPDRIPKSQLRAIYLLHENFVRNLMPSLSAYLRSYVVANLVSIEQLKFGEFLEYLPTPTCLAALGLLPHDGIAVLELNPSLAFPIIEILLGGNAKCSPAVVREATEIELSLLDGLFHVILRDLTEAWQTVAPVDFRVECLKTDPKLLPIVAQNEAVVAIAIELRIGEIVGMVNIAVPSVIVKMSRQKLDQQWPARKTSSTHSEQTRVMNLLLGSQLRLEARLEGTTLLMNDLLRLKEGDILGLDYPVQQPIGCRVNGKLKFRGQVLAQGNRLGFLVEERTSGTEPTADPL